MAASTPLFLGWEDPWLPRLAKQLLLEGDDLSKVIIILPGKRAGRRLLELLALTAQEKELLLIPPRIVTLEEAVALTLLLPDRKPEAGTFHERLAWQVAAAKLSEEELHKIQHFPEHLTLPEKEAASHRLAALAAKVATELHAIGLTIAHVASTIGQLSPESADTDEPRWQTLARLQEIYYQVLAQWGFSDRLETQHQRLLNGTATQDYRIIAAGVVDYAPVFDLFFQKINLELILIAPESHASGFHPYGRIITSYWLEHPAIVKEKSLIACERSTDQATEALKLLLLWKEHLETAEKTPGPLSSLITIVAPEQAALTFLREKYSQASFSTRWAGGRFFKGGSLFALLEALKEYLSPLPAQAPSLKAVALLLRHPALGHLIESSLSISCEQLISLLDQWEREHLPQFLERDHLALFKKQAPLIALLAKLEEIFPFSRKPEPITSFLSTLNKVLSDCFDEELVYRTTPEGHYFLGCLEKLLFFLEEMEALSAQTTVLFQPSDLLALLLEMLSKETIPEPEQSDAIEILGWLEAAADDTPCLLLTSFHEGAVPEAIPSDPLLSASLRRALRLPQQEDRLARDHYLLHVILESRKKEGSATFLAPRYNGRGEPVRASRLLLQGCDDTELPTRTLLLTQRQNNSSEKESAPGRQHSLFQARPLTPVALDRITVTAFKAYLQSPRLFYLQYVLKLQEVLETPLEMNARQFGTIIHTVLGRLGADTALSHIKEPAVLTTWLHHQLEKVLHTYFGKHPGTAIWSQREELAATLTGFARAEAAHRQEGWITIATEETSSQAPSLLEETLHLSADRSLILQGRIDRVDWHPQQQRWLLIDYKTSHRQEWKKQTPNQEHYQKKGDLIIWKDLQLPLYLKLVPHLEALQQTRLPLPTLETTDLCYFQLPMEPEAAGLSEPFASSMVEPAWHEAERLASLILEGHFEELGNMTPEHSPTLAALGGLAGLWTPSSSPEE